MEFKIGDIVFLNKRGVIDWETQDDTIGLVKNRPYIIALCDYTNNKIGIKGITTLFHPNHFKLHNILDGIIQENKFFKVGDKVCLERNYNNADLIDLYIRWYGVIEKEIYEILECDFAFSGQNHKTKFLINFYGKFFFKSNCFKKVENGI